MEFPSDPHLNAGNRAQDQDGPVKDTQGSLDLDRKVDVTFFPAVRQLLGRKRNVSGRKEGRTWRVDDVDAVLAVVRGVDALLDVPVRKGRRRLDRDALLTLEFHRVHLGADTVAASDLVDRRHAAGVEQNAFRQGRLACEP